MYEISEKKNLLESNHEEKKNCRVQATGKKNLQETHAVKKKFAQLQMFMPPSDFQMVNP